MSPLYVTWFFGNGSLPGRWKPAKTGSGAAWELSPQLQPLASFKSYLTVISGLENKLVVSGIEHPTGSAGATTGAPLSGNAVRAASIDQVVADAISTGAPFRSLEVGVTPATPNGTPDSLHTVSHKGPNARNNPEFDPKAVFTRLFMGGTHDDAAAAGPGHEARERAEERARRRPAGRRRACSSGSGRPTRQRVEQHLEAIRAIEKRLATMPPTPMQPAMCTSPTAPTVGKDTQERSARRR